MDSFRKEKHIEKDGIPDINKLDMLMLKIELMSGKRSSIARLYPNYICQLQN